MKKGQKSTKKRPLKVSFTQLSIEHEKVIYGICSDSVNELLVKLKDRRYKLHISESDKQTMISSLHSKILFGIPTIWGIFAHSLDEK
jgi:hypothetical protein